MDGKFKIFVIVAIVVLALAIAGSTFVVMKMVNGQTAVVDTAKVEQEEAPKLAEVALGDAILTNITSENNAQHYAKVKISIGVDASDSKASDALKAEIEGKAASVRSEVISTVGEQTYTMLSNTTTGKEKLADEIITRLNKLLNTDMVKAVYFEEYFVQ